ncbi:DUF3243 domain-containing protein [Bacillus tianshenii]|nr:DUF3243 domain-containing protein [Bacillus tianshenii]
MSVLDNFDTWKGFLGQRLNQAQQDGLDNATVSNVAYEIGDYLAKQVDPKNPEERILAELWQVATPEEQHAIANMMVKLVKNEAK